MASRSNPYNRIQTVLLTEDDNAIRETLGIFLDSLGLSHIDVADGIQAVSIFETRKVDLLITDFRMPNMDGIELLQWCRSRKMHLPVIFVSANADLVKAESIALEDCCATLMHKPIDLDSLIAALDAAEQLIHHPNCVHNRIAPV